METNLLILGASSQDIVERLDTENNQLLSRSKDTSKPYDPIPLDEDHQIVGIVIAIAKPAR